MAEDVNINMLCCGCDPRAVIQQSANQARMQRPLKAFAVRRRCPFFLFTLRWQDVRVGSPYYGADGALWIPVHPKLSTYLFWNGIAHWKEKVGLGPHQFSNLARSPSSLWRGAATASFHGICKNSSNPCRLHPVAGKMYQAQNMQAPRTGEASAAARIGGRQIHPGQDPGCKLHINTQRKKKHFLLLHHQDSVLQHCMYSICQDWLYASNTTEVNQGEIQSVEAKGLFIGTDRELQSWIYVSGKHWWSKTIFW